jgi:hypothetical protein
MAVSLRTGTTGNYNPAYGGVPQVPNIIDVYGQGIAANQKYLPQLTQLGSSITGATEEELLNNLRRALPGYDTSVAKSMGNIGALQRGEIPQDVSNLISRQAAERGIATGLYNSPNANAALLGALGQTSLGLQNEGEKQMSALVNRTPQAQPYDVSRLFLNPTDLYESQLLANIYKSAPVPEAAARQMTADAAAGYHLGRNNVPSYSSGMPNLATPPNVVRSDPGQMAAVGGLGPFPTATKSTPYRPVMGNMQAGGGEVPGMEWDDDMGMYYNRFTGQYVTDEGGDSGFSWGGQNPIDFSDVTGPTYDTAETAVDPNSDYYDF